MFDDQPVQVTFWRQTIISWEYIFKCTASLDNKNKNENEFLQCHKIYKISQFLHVRRQMTDSFEYDAKKKKKEKKCAFTFHMRYPTYSA